MIDVPPVLVVVPPVLSQYVPLLRELAGVRRVRDDEAAAARVFAAADVGIEAVEIGECQRGRR